MMYIFGQNNLASKKPLGVWRGVIVANVAVPAYLYDCCCLWLMIFWLWFIGWYSLIHSVLFFKLEGGIHRLPSAIYPIQLARSPISSLYGLWTLKSRMLWSNNCSQTLALTWFGRNYFPVRTVSYHRNFTMKAVSFSKLDHRAVAIWQVLWAYVYLWFALPVAATMMSFGHFIIHWSSNQILASSLILSTCHTLLQQSGSEYVCYLIVLQFKHSRKLLWCILNWLLWSRTLH
jgi:hypothetical protein